MPFVHTSAQAEAEAEQALTLPESKRAREGEKTRAFAQGQVEAEAVPPLHPKRRLDSEKAQCSRLASGQAVGGLRQLHLKQALEKGKAQASAPERAERAGLPLQRKRASKR